MKLTHWLCLFAILLAAVGCGGSGSGGGGNVGTSALFATDDLSNADHVWVTIEQVVLVKQGGSTITVFDDPGGATIDLRTLRDASGERFAFLSAIPAGSYTGIRVTVDKDVVIYESGSNIGLVRQFAGNNGTTAVLSATFNPAVVVNASTPFVIDFSLSDWSDDGTTVTGTPFLKLGTGAGIHDPNRHDRDDMEGAVTQLSGTAPNQTFVLVRGHNHINVTLNAQTRLLRSDGHPTPTLANGQQVTVNGTFDLNTNAVIADWVEIHGSGTPHDHGIEGILVSSDPLAGTFVLEVHDAHGFLPEHGSVNVATSPATVFQSGGGVTISNTEFFAALQPGIEVRVTGDYTLATNTIAAATARIDSENENEPAEIEGPISNLNATNLTFDVTAMEWEGLNLPPNSVIHITLDLNTQVSLNGNTLTQTEFFAQIANGMHARVEGIYDANTQTMAATEIRVTST